MSNVDERDIAYSTPQGCKEATLKIIEHRHAEGGYTDAVAVAMEEAVIELIQRNSEKWLDRGQFQRSPREFLGLAGHFVHLDAEDERFAPYIEAIKRVLTAEGVPFVAAFMEHTGGGCTAIEVRLTEPRVEGGEHPFIALSDLDGPWHVSFYLSWSDEEARINPLTEQSSWRGEGTNPFGDRPSLEVSPSDIAECVRGLAVRAHEWMKENPDALAAVDREAQEAARR